jgi:hypothetical protein
MAARAGAAKQRTEKGKRVALESDIAELLSGPDQQAGVSLTMLIDIKCYRELV